jgi:hypothetical protein
MDPAVIDALSRGDYQRAGTTAALNTAIGSVVGGATAKGLQALQAAGYARPAAAIGSGLPLAGGLLAGQGLVETGKALNRAYKSRTGKDFVDRNQVPSSIRLTLVQLLLFSLAWVQQYLEVNLFRFRMDPLQVLKQLVVLGGMLLDLNLKMH